MTYGAVPFLFNNPQIKTLKGLTNSEIGAGLHISLNTVKVHNQNI